MIELNIITWKVVFQPSQSHVPSISISPRFQIVQPASLSTYEKYTFTTHYCYAKTLSTEEKNDTVCGFYRYYQ